MGQKIEDPNKSPDGPLTEREVTPDLHATGAGIERTPHTVRMVFWSHLPPLGSESEERRIVGRIAMPVDAARMFSRALAEALRTSKEN